MYSVSDRWAPALASSHGVAVQVDLLYDGAVVQRNIRITDGMVTVDRGAEVRRSLRLSLPDPSVLPELPTDFFSPFGYQLYVQRGIRYLDGSVEMVPLGYFAIQSISGDLRTGPLEIQAPGLESLIQQAPFEVAVSTSGAQTAAAFIATQLAAVDPSLDLVDTSSGGASLLPRVTYDAGTDRWKTLREVATSVGAELFVSADGTFVLADIPEPSDEFVWTVAARETLVAASAGWSADGVYNRVVVYGENVSESAPPVYAIAEISDSADPLHVGGPFGLRVYTHRSNLVTTTLQAEALASRLLPQVSALHRSVRVSSVPNPALDAGDRIRVVYGSRPPELHTVQRFDVPLRPGGDFVIETASGVSA